MEEPRTLTPAEILDIVRRRRTSLVLPAVLVLAAGVLVAFLLPAVYKSSATILIEEQEIPAEFVMTTVTSFAEQRIQQITQRIMSFARLLEIIQRFNLYPEMKESRTTEEVVEQMRRDTELKPLSAEVIDRRTGRPTSATIAFSLSYQGKNPNTVQQVANTLTSLYLEENLRVRTRQAAEATEFLEGEMARVKQELAEIEAQLAGFKEAHINELPEMMQVNMQTLAAIDRNIESAEAQLRSYKEREGYLQTQLVGIKPRMEKEDILISRKHLEELRIQLGNMLQRFSEEHPDVRKIRTEIRDLEKRVEVLEAQNRKVGEAPDNPAYVALASQLASTRADIDSVRRQIADLNRSAADYRRRIAATPRVEEDYSVLMVARAGTQAKVNDLMKKLMEARVAHGLEKEQKGERFTLVDPPRLPEKPFKPNRLAIVLIAAVLGIGAGVGMAALREVSDDTVRGVEGLETRTGFPVLAGIPAIATARDLTRRRQRRAALAAGTLGAALAGVAVFHYFIMDLDVFWVRLMRKIAL
jgi:polysaccharide chain length determinant protein (PEP-CTERM system associated)